MKAIRCRLMLPMVALSYSLPALAQEPPFSSADFLQNAPLRGALATVNQTRNLPGAGVTLDGDLTEWGKSTEFSRRAALLHQGMVAGGDQTHWWYGADGISPDEGAKTRRYDAAALRFAYDEKAVYVACRVVDDVVSTSPNAPRAWGDAVEVVLDFRPLRLQTGQGLGAWDMWGNVGKRGVFGFVAVPNTKTGERARLEGLFTSSDATQLVDEIADLEIALTTRPDGYDFEARLPLESLKWGEGADQRVTPARLKEPWALAARIFDRDGDRVRPAYSWTRDERRAPFGVLWPNTTSREAKPNDVLSLQLTQARVELGRRFVRAGAWVAGDKNTTNPLKFNLEYRSYPALKTVTRFSKQIDPTPYARQGIADLLAGKAPQTVLGDAYIDDYPSLGLTFVRRDMTFDSSPGGTYVLSANAGEKYTRRAFFLGNDGFGFKEIAIEAVESDVTAVDATKLLKGAYLYVNSPTQFLIRGEVAQGTIGFFTENALGLTQAFAALEEKGGRFEAEFTLQKSKVLSGFDFAAEGESVWKGTFPVSVFGIAYEIPTATLERGLYQMKWKLFAVSGGKREELNGISESSTPLVVTGPRERTLASTITDAPQLLRSVSPIGSPFKTLDRNDEIRINDMQAFAGRIYASGGVLRQDRPAQIWSFSPGKDEANSWRSEVELAGVELSERTAQRLRLLGNGAEEALAVTGMFSKEPGGSSFNYKQRKPNDTKPDAYVWIQKSTLPGALLLYDVAVWRGRLVAGTYDGAVPGNRRLQISEDFGNTWKTVIESRNVDYNYRFSADILAALPDGVFMVREQAANYGAFWWDGEKTTRLVTDLLPVRPDGPQNQSLSRLIGRLTPFATPDSPNGLLYAPQGLGATQPLCFLPSAQAEGAVAVEVFAEAQVRDIVTRDGTVYVLTGRRRAAKVRNGLNPDEIVPMLYDGEVFSSRDLKSWTRHANFESNALPNTLEIAPGGNSTAFYVGLSGEDYREPPVSAGNVLKLVP